MHQLGKSNDFDAIQPNASGLFEPNQIIQTNAEEVKKELSIPTKSLKNKMIYGNLIQQ